MKYRMEKARVQRRAQRNRQLAVGAGILIPLAALLFVFMNNRAGNSDARAISRLSTNDFHSLAFSPTEPETVFFGHHDGLLVSRNGGMDWQAAALTNADAMSLALPAADPQVMYAAGHDVFVKSVDAGRTWTSVSTNLPGLDIHAFAVDPENADRVFAFVVGFGLFGSQDGGVGWEILSTAVPPSVHGLSVGEDGQNLYAAAAGAGLWKSADGGRYWLQLDGAPDQGAIAVLDVRENGRLYITTLGGEPGLYLSDDQGATWESAGLSGILLAIAASPLDPEHLLVVNEQGEVFASRDGGVSWDGE